MDVAITVTIVVSIGTVIVGVIGYLLNRSIRAVDEKMNTAVASVSSVDTKVTSLTLDVAKLPTWDDLKSETREVADNRVIKHERDEHRINHPQVVELSQRS